MAVNAYLHIDGIEGPSGSRSGFIDIISYSWGVTQTQTYSAGASGQETKAGRADFANLIIKKVTDATTPFLTYNCAMGTILSNAYILYDKPVGDKQQDYFRIYLKDALITSVQMSAEKEDTSETISFAFQAVEIAYKPEKDDGSLDAAISKGFNLATLMPDYAADKPMQ